MQHRFCPVDAGDASASAWPLWLNFMAVARASRRYIVMAGLVPANSLSR